MHSLDKPLRPITLLAISGILALSLSGCDREVGRTASETPVHSSQDDSASRRPNYELATVEIRKQVVDVEIAESAAVQALGLGQRDELAWDTGMLFVYERPAFYAFWMKGMRFSIDIIWIYQGRIVGIEPSVPFEKGGNGPTVRPKSLVDAVLEVPAGYSSARGWRVGDRVLVDRPDESR